MIRGYKFAMEPTDEQARRLRSHCGAARIAYNHCVARDKANWFQRLAERSYGIPDKQLTPKLSTSFYSLRKAWNAEKADIAPWWAENSKEAYATGCANFSAAMKNKVEGRADYPRFKTRRSHMSCRFTTGALGLGRDLRHLKLPVIGQVRTAESTRKLARRVEAGTARIRSATVSFKGRRWFVSLSVELPDRAVNAARPPLVVGVDLGIKYLATLSTGETFPNPRHFDQTSPVKARLQRRVARRRGPDRRSGQVPSNRWLKAQAQVARLDTRIANLRRDYTHKMTSWVAHEFDVVVLENLAVQNMIKNRKLSRQIAGANWAEIRRQFEYKSQRVLIADRWFPSSKTCSECGEAKAKLALSERTFACISCGIVLDRDVNAAINLAELVDRLELPGELPAGTDVRHWELASSALGSPREEFSDSNPRREVVDHGMVAARSIVVLL